MNDGFLCMTELGRFYGISGKRMGQRLTKIGLRTERREPSHMAREGGYVRQRPSTNPGTFYYVWHVEKTMQLLEQHGYRVVGRKNA